MLDAYTIFHYVMVILEIGIFVYSIITFKNKKNWSRSSLIFRALELVEQKIFNLVNLTTFLIFGLWDTSFLNTQQYRETDDEDPSRLTIVQIIYILFVIVDIVITTTNWNPNYEAGAQDLMGLGRKWVLLVKKTNYVQKWSPWTLHVTIKSCYNQCNWQLIDPLTCLLGFHLKLLMKITFNCISI